jgi:hypothetical protein
MHHLRAELLPLILLLLFPLLLFAPLLWAIKLFCRWMRCISSNPTSRLR